MFEFDTAVAGRETGPGNWEVDIHDGWDFFGIPNGGLLMATVAGLIGPPTGHPDPVSITAHFVARAEAGPARVEGEILRSGRVPRPG